MKTILTTNHTKYTKVGRVGFRTHRLTLSYRKHRFFCRDNRMGEIKRRDKQSISLPPDPADPVIPANFLRVYCAINLRKVCVMPLRSLEEIDG